MAERLALRLKNVALPGNVDRVYATKVAGVSATLTHYLEKAKTSVHEESGFLEFELAAETQSPSGVSLGNSAVEKYVLNVNDVSQVIEY